MRTLDFGRRYEVAELAARAGGERAVGTGEFGRYVSAGMEVVREKVDEDRRESCRLAEMRTERGRVVGKRAGRCRVVEDRRESGRWVERRMGLEQWCRLTEHCRARDQWCWLAQVDRPRTGAAEVGSPQGQVEALSGGVEAQLGRWSSCASAEYQIALEVGTGDGREICCSRVLAERSGASPQQPEGGRAFVCE